MVVLAGTLDGIVVVRLGAAGAEVAEGSKGLAGGNVRDRVGLGGNDGEDGDDLRDAADRDGPR